MENKGVIYILTNPLFPEYVKIGYADDVKYMKIKLLEKYPVGQFPSSELREKGLVSVQGHCKATAQLAEYLNR